MTGFPCHPERSEGSVSMALSCHPEHSEGSVSLGLQMLRGVYTEHSECAQHDRGPSFVTLSIAKGLSPWPSRCFVALSMTVPSSCRALAPKAFDGLFLG